MQTLPNTHLDLESSGDHVGSRLSDVSEDSVTVSSEIIGVVLEDNNNNIYINNNDDVEVKEGRGSSVSVCSVVDLESGGGGAHEDGCNTTNNKVHLLKNERDCRICHLSIDLTNEDCENGICIELGCCCKEDLAAAHKHCAEAWFKIKGNKICEICGSIAHNVAGVYEAEQMEQWNEANDAMTSANVPGGTRTATSDNRNFWQGHRFLNFLLACMVFAFVISWLFHFNVPS